MDFFRYSAKLLSISSLGKVVESPLTELAFCQDSTKDQGIVSGCFVALRSRSRAGTWRLADDNYICA